MILNAARFFFCQLSICKQVMWGNEDMAITDWPADERPREKLLERGGASLSDSELMAIFLRTGIKGKSAVELARDLLAHFDGLRGVMEAPPHRFEEVKGMGQAKWVQLQACLELGKRYLETTLDRADAFTSPAATRQYLRARLRGYHHEVFACLFLDNQNRLIRYEELFTGYFPQVIHTMRQFFVLKSCAYLTFTVDWLALANIIRPYNVYSQHMYLLGVDHALKHSSSSNSQSRYHRNFSRDSCHHDG